MVKKLSATDKALAQQTAEKYYEYERLATEQASILRASDQKAYADAYNTYVAQCQVREGFTPPSNEIDEHIVIAEQSARIQCNSLLDHVTVLNAAMFLMRLYSMKACAKSLDIFYAAMSLRNEMEINDPLPRSPIPENFTAPLPQHATTSIPFIPPSTDVPATLNNLAASFTLDSVVNLPRKKISAADILKFRRNPDDLVGETFVFMDEDCESAFIVSTILMVGKGSNMEKFFYVQFADEKDANFPLKNDHFFELLAISAQVIM